MFVIRLTAVVWMLLLAACSHDTRYSVQGVSFDLPRSWKHVPPPDVDRLVQLEQLNESRQAQVSMDMFRRAKVSLRMASKNDHAMFTWYGRAPDSLSRGQYVLMFRGRLHPVSALNQAELARSFMEICTDITDSGSRQGAPHPVCNVTSVHDKPVLRAGILHEPPRSPTTRAVENILVPLQNGDVLLIVIAAAPESKAQVDRGIDQLLQRMRE